MSRLGHRDEIFAHLLALFNEFGIGREITIRRPVGLDDGLGRTERQRQPLVDRALGAPSFVSEKLHQSRFLWNAPLGPPGWFAA
jgi:hypothetical protein